MELTTLGKTPIQGKSPAGIDVRYEPEFETIQSEIDKLASPSAQGQPDWAKIVEQAAAILLEKSKDLTVASYLAVGLVLTRKIEGLDIGLQLIHDLLENFWDTLFPSKKRLRGRVGALQWWLEKTNTELQTIKPYALNAELAERMLANLKHIDALAVEYLPEPPLFGTLQRLIQAFPIQKPEPEKSAEVKIEPGLEKSDDSVKPTTSKTTTAPITETAPIAEVDETLTNAQDARRAVDTAFNRIRQASLVLLKNDLKDPLAYSCRRIATWTKLVALPPQTDGATQITPPPPQMIDSINELRDEGNWEALIENVEQKLSQYIFWFDLNYFTAEGLKNLGNAYKKALTAVCRETAYVLQKLPGLESLTFSDGMPFAQPETRKWLKRIAPAAAGATVDSGMDADSDERFDAALQKARAMVRKKKLLDAVSMLQQQMHASVGRSDQLRWRLTLIQVMISAKKVPQALPHLEKILADIEHYQLEEWDPCLALQGLTIAWSILSKQTTNENKIQTADLLHRIAKIDPVQALRLQA